MLLSVFGNGCLIKCLTEKEIMNEKKLLLIVDTKAFFIALMCVVALAMCHGCMSEDKLVGKAIKSEAATNAILALHPCNTKDSVVSKSDTSIVHDTATISKMDTVGLFVHDTVKVKITTTKVIHDTINNYRFDPRSISILTSNLSDSNKELATLRQQVKDCPKTTDKWLWWFIGAIVLLAVSWALFIYLKLKL